MINPVELFKTLGDETRLRLVNLVLQSDNDLCVCEMVDSMDLPQYQISKHLTVLRNAGLLRATRIGTWVYYRLDDDAAPLLHGLFDALSPRLAPLFAEDAVKLRQRLALRKEDLCIVGLASSEE